MFDAVDGILSELGGKLTLINIKKTGIKNAVSYWK